MPTTRDLLQSYANSNQVLADKNNNFVVTRNFNEPAKLSGLPMAGKYAEGTDNYYRNIDPNTSVRPPYDASVYNYFREGERVPIPRTQDDYRLIMNLCKSAYERVGVVRSVVDMMSEFGAEGIQILHPDDGPNAFYKAWSQRVHLEDRAERFLSWVYKSGNVVVRRHFGTLTTQETRQMKAVAADDNSIKPGYIPLEYKFYDPAMMEIVGGAFGALADKKMYALRIPLLTNALFRLPITDLEKQVFQSLAPELQDALKGKAKIGNILLLPIDNSKLFVGCYKKDDQDMWAKSFIYSILSDIFYNDKLKLAKTSGLDSFYNAIRLWKMGDHTLPVPLFPDPAAMEKFATILTHNTGGGTADIIWRSDIDVKELYPPLDQLVNFEENIHNILMGLGVPEGLVGGKAAGSAGMSTNYLGLKNLIKRLEAGRRMIREWLDIEIDIIQKNMGFRKRPIVRFANNDLHDERTYAQLMINLLDRNVISDETVLERFNEFVDIERSRLSKEHDLRQSGQLGKKAGPYYKPELADQQQHELDKIKLQGKMQKDLKTVDNQNNPDNSNNVTRRINKVPLKRGRPDNSKDTVTRKRGPNKVKSPRASLILEATKIYDFVDTYLKQQALAMYGVDNIRKLTSEQELDLDKSRVALLPHIRPFEELSDTTVATAIEYLDGPQVDFHENYLEALGSLSTENITTDQKRMIRIMAYVDSWLET